MFELSAISDVSVSLWYGPAEMNAYGLHNSGEVPIVKPEPRETNSLLLPRYTILDSNCLQGGEHHCRPQTKRRRGEDEELGVLHPSPSQPSSIFPSRSPKRRRVIPSLVRPPMAALQNASYVTSSAPSPPPPPAHLLGPCVPPPLPTSVRPRPCIIPFPHHLLTSRASSQTPDAGYAPPLTAEVYNPPTRESTIVPPPTRDCTSPPTSRSISLPPIAALDLPPSLPPSFLPMVSRAGEWPGAGVLVAPSPRVVFPTPLAALQTARGPLVHAPPSVAAPTSPRPLARPVSRHRKLSSPMGGRAL